MNKEDYKIIDDFPNYEISNLGNIRNKKTKRILKPHKNKGGYLSVLLYKECIPYRKDIHRLVAQVFIPNPENKPEVNHLDENKENNNINNLSWCTRQENNNWGTRTQRASTKHCKPILQLDLDDNILKEWLSASEASKALNIAYTNISACCNGHRKSTGNYKWRFK